MLFGFYDAGPAGLAAFIAVTVVIGGLAAFAAGRAIADTWRPRWQVPAYMLLLAAGVRFVQFSVLGAKLLSPGSYLVDFAVLTAIAGVAFQVTRGAQMARQYGFGEQRGTP